MHLGHTSRWISWLQQGYLGKPIYSGCRRGFAISIPRKTQAPRSVNQPPNEATRNIGIIAHIDAGKTTTTERMLYYSGYTRRIGDVDDGSTVTDFLPAERARGITIQSAAITFHWPPLSIDYPITSSDSTTAKAIISKNDPSSHTINLIDTPGHADFTFEVLRSLRILDGAVCILDGVAGVEAQTEKVWHQAATYKIPKIIYVNKLDRDGAAFGRTVKEIASKLHAWPAVCQIPWFEGGGGRFIGIVDVVRLRALRWADGGDGKSFKVIELTELAATESRLVEEAMKARIALVELLSEHDDSMVEKYLECDEDHMAISSADVIASLRYCVLGGVANIVPVFAGASFRNVGVQPILDAIISLLPGPEESPDPTISVGHVNGGLRDLVNGKLKLTEVAKLSKDKKSLSSSKKSSIASTQNLESCALAFKVVNDPKRGVLVYVRVYHGNLSRNALLFNTNLQISERVPRLLKMYASDAVEISSISAGQIGVITGLKHARTGDTLISYTGANSKSGPPAPLNGLQLRPIDVPPPVFFASIEPQSLSEEKPVAQALALLLREDPSLQLSVDEDSGQTLLSGMGELHLEIAKDRLTQDLKAKATMGKIEIGYRECISASGGPKDVVFDKEIAGRKGKAGCTASVRSLSEDTNMYDVGDDQFLNQDGNIISVTVAVPEIDSADFSFDSLLPSHLSLTTVISALQNGALAALARGPTHFFALRSTHVSLTFDPQTHIFGIDTTPAALSSAARIATQAALKASAEQVPTTLMEPVMNVIISVDERSLGPVVHDLTSSRGAQIISLDNMDVVSTVGDNHLSRDDVPLIDTRRVYAPPDPFEAPSVDGDLQENIGRQRTITARVPLKEMVGYLRYLRSLTGGRGTFVMSVDAFERMGSQRERVVLREMRGL